MDVSIVQTVISELGFPIAICCACGYYILKKDKQQEDDKNKLYEELAQNREERKSFIEVLNRFNARFEVLETKVDGISYKLDKEGK